MLSTKSLMHTNPKFAIISTGFMSVVLTLSMLTTAIKFSSPLASALALMPGNQTIQYWWKKYDYARRQYDIRR